MHNIGAVLLNDLNNPEDALSWLRKASGCDPDDRQHRLGIAESGKIITQNNTRAERETETGKASAKAPRGYIGTTSGGDSIELIVNGSQAWARITTPGRGTMAAGSGVISGDSPFRLVPSGRVAVFAGEIKAVLHGSTAQGSFSFCGGTSGAGMVSGNWSARRK